MNIFDRIASGIGQRAVAETKKRTPGKVQKHLPLARKLLFGGPEEFLNAGIDDLMAKYGVLGGPGTRIPWPSTALLEPTPLVGGITLKQAREIFDECVETAWQKKNLWFIAITNLSGGDAPNMNLFATDVSYPGFSVTGDAVLVGGGSFDLPTNSERREIRVTTMDDDYGTIKRWFKDRHDRMFNADGTMGLPVDYLFRVDIIHARVTDRLAPDDEPFWDSFIARAGTIENDLSRREDQLAEFQMNFVQYDTFTGLS